MATANTSARSTLLAAGVLLAHLAMAQSTKPTDTTEPGDAMIHSYLARRARQLDAGFAVDLAGPEEWTRARPRLADEYLYMMGLWPTRERTPLNATITGALPQEGYTVDKLHFQSLPHLYVTANLYRPSQTKAGERLPAVVYVCGHGSHGRDGNKTVCQSHGIWFARHGYVALILDTLQKAEIPGGHRGLYSQGKRWWHSRGYTPAGVECWNGIRAIDYLVSRPDVDPHRLAVTGISGGGATTFWIAAADDRITVAVPVSGMADLEVYVSDGRIVNHCDCMFLYNVFGWPWTRIASLVAPRPMLFVNSDQDRFFPLDGDERVASRLERLYGMLGAGDRVDSVVSVGQHEYRKDIRQAVYRFINTHLKGDPAVVTDSEMDLIQEEGDKAIFPIEPASLRVFPEDSDIPKDQINSTIDQHFVPIARVQPPGKGGFERWKANLVAELRRVSFRDVPERVPPARHLGEPPGGVLRMSAEEGIEFRLFVKQDRIESASRHILLVVRNADEARGAESPGWLTDITRPGDEIFLCDPRGVGETRWTTTTPPNEIERAHALLGLTVDTGRVRDIAATARYLRQQSPGMPIVAAGRGPAAVLVAYAALLEADIEEVIAIEPPPTHMNGAAPQFLNVLRVCDIPEVLGMLAPRRLSIASGSNEMVSRVRQIYDAADAADQLQSK